jgi:hypothetical protein
LLRKYGHFKTSKFASGDIYLSSIVDGLLVQSYYNDSLITILDHLIVGSVDDKSKESFL